MIVNIIDHRIGIVKIGVIILPHGNGEGELASWIKVISNMQLITGIVRKFITPLNLLQSFLS
jgi:hypothetical protein